MDLLSQLPGSAIAGDLALMWLTGGAPRSSPFREPAPSARGRRPHGPSCRVTESNVLPLSTRRGADRQAMEVSQTARHSGADPAHPPPTHSPTEAAEDSPEGSVTPASLSRTSRRPWQAPGTSSPTGRRRATGCPASGCRQARSGGTCERDSARWSAARRPSKSQRVMDRDFNQARQPIPAPRRV
jgi:hypothetical protein